MKKECCVVWEKGIDLIRVEDRGSSPEGKTSAEALTKILKYQMGHYCPTCGENLISLPKKKRKNNSGEKA